MHVGCLAVMSVINIGLISDNYPDTEGLFCVFKIGEGLSCLIWDKNIDSDFSLLCINFAGRRAQANPVTDNYQSH